MEFLAICRKCEEPSAYWSITRPPPETDVCRFCPGEVVIARSNTGADITAVFDKIHPGATPKRVRVMVGKIARKIERGQISVETMVRAMPRTSASRHRGDVKIGYIAFAGLGAASAAYMISSSTNLDDLARELATSVLKKIAREEEWIPKPGDPVAVLEKPAKGKRKPGNQRKTRAPSRSAASGAHKPSRPGGAKAKGKRKSES